jgi:hypothetical protein
MKNCPASDCKAANPRQRTLIAGELSEMGHPSWGSRAMICTYCQCVYTRELKGPPIIRGWYDNAILGAGWKPMARTIGL